MARMEIDLPDDVADRVEAAAAAEGLAPEALAGKAICESFPVRRKLSFVALGRSTSGNRAADDEKLLAEGFWAEHRRDFRVVRPAHCDAFELVPTPTRPPAT